MKEDRRLIFPAAVIAAVLVLLLLLSTLIITERGECGEEAQQITWTLSAGGRLKVTGTGKTGSYSADEKIPSPFYHRSVVTAALSEGITAIGDEAFYDCYNLRTLSIPDSVTSIGRRAFYGCDKLSSIRLGENAAFTYRDGALTDREGDALLFASPRKIAKSYAVPEGVKEIAPEAFSGCNKLTSLTLPNSVTALGEGAFLGCTKLTEILLPGENANFVFEDGVLFNKEKTALLFCASAAGKESYTVPPGVKEIAPMAFYGCRTLTELTLPEGLERIGDAAFYGCTKLETIGCGKAFVYENGALYNAEKTTLLFCSPAAVTETVALPESVTAIAPGAFYACKTMETLTLPALSSIGAHAFTNCSSLTELLFGGTEEAWLRLNEHTDTGIVETVVSIRYAK